MKKLFKTFFSICICAILSLLILPCVSAQLNAKQKAVLDQVCSHYVDAYASSHLPEWREMLIKKVNAIASTNPHDPKIVAEALIYVASKITDRATLRDIKIRGFRILGYYGLGNRLQHLSCQITIMDNWMIVLDF